MCKENCQADVKSSVAGSENADTGLLSEVPQKKEVVMRNCLNCGTLSSGNYCPNCGQSMSVGRMKSQSLFKQFLCSFLRLDPVFLKTLGLLIVKPWKVIKDYLDGHQICFSSPVTTLVIIFFFRTILSLIMGVSGDGSFKDIWTTQYPGFTDGQILVFRMVDTIMFIDIVRLMLTRLPLILAVKLVYNGGENRKYTWGEYMTASVYILCSVTACSIVTDLFIAPFFGDDVADYIAMGYSLVILFLTMQKILPCKNFFIAIVKYAFTVVLGVIFFFIYIISLCLLVLCVLYMIEPNTMEELVNGF